jgi:hypothetical protein
MQTKPCGPLAVLALLFACTNVSAAPIATLTLHSQPGDFIGQGGNFDLTYPQNEEDPIDIRYAAYINGQPSNVLFYLIGSEGEAAINVATRQLGFPLTPGTYLDAQLDPLETPGHPGLSVSFRGLACDTITGNFTITDATFSANNTLSSFGVSFEQHCNGVAPALFGTLTYNANGAAPIPEPAGYWFVGMGVVALLSRRGLGTLSREPRV